METILDSGEVGINAADESEITAIQVPLTRSRWGHYFTTSNANGQDGVVSLLIERGDNSHHDCYDQ